MAGAPGEGWAECADRLAELIKSGLSVDAALRKVKDDKFWQSALQLED